MFQDIDRLRESINRVDMGLLDLLIERGRYVKQIGEYKREKGLPIRDKTRESIHVGKLVQHCNDAGVPELALMMLIVFRAIIESSVRMQGQSSPPSGPMYCVSCEWTTNGIPTEPLGWPTCPRCHMPLLVTRNVCR